MLLSAFTPHHFTRHSTAQDQQRSKQFSLQTRVQSPQGISHGRPLLEDFMLYGCVTVTASSSMLQTKIARENEPSLWPRVGSNSPQIGLLRCPVRLAEEGEIIATLLDKNTISNLHQHEYSMLQAANAKSYMDFDASESNSSRDAVLFNGDAKLHVRQWDNRDKDSLHFAVQQEHLHFSN
jgi:hypothetical protein